jgi:hypothetical protein
MLLWHLPTSLSLPTFSPCPPFFLAIHAWFQHLLPAGSVSLSLFVCSPLHKWDHNIVLFGSLSSVPSSHFTYLSPRSLTHLPLSFFPSWNVSRPPPMSQSLTFFLNSLSVTSSPGRFSFNLLQFSRRRYTASHTCKDGFVCIIFWLLNSYLRWRSRTHTRNRCTYFETIFSRRVFCFVIWIETSVCFLRGLLLDMYRSNTFFESEA